MEVSKKGSIAERKAYKSLPHVLMMDNAMIERSEMSENRRRVMFVRE